MDEKDWKDMKLSLAELQVNLDEMEVSMPDNMDDMQVSLYQLRVSLYEIQVTLYELQVNTAQILKTPEDLNERMAEPIGPATLHNAGARNWNSQITSETTRFSPLHDITNEPIPGFPRNMQHLSHIPLATCRRVLHAIRGTKDASKIQRLSAEKCRDELMFEIGVNPRLKGSGSSSRRKRKFEKKVVIDLTADESDDEVSRLRSWP